MPNTEQVQCFACHAECPRGQSGGDYITVKCEECGSYRMGGTAATLLHIGTLTITNLEAFRHLVSDRRGDSDEYPLITEPDIQGLP